MGRPPSNGAPSFRFLPSEVAEMEARLQQLNNGVPSRAVLQSIADKFSASPERAGKLAVQPKQVWNWFQNRRYSHRAKATRPAPPPPAKMTPSGADHHQHAVPSAAFRAAQPSAAHANPGSSASGKNSMETCPVEFEAKSARDGAWYDVAAFLAHRSFETGDPEVRVRFIGFGAEEDEWINVRKCVRQRSLPCEANECVAVLPGDLILCFQEGKEQALYFDARVLDAQRRRHDIRGCRCRFLVRYDHDSSEEIVPLRKVCRRPETDYRLQILHAARAAAAGGNADVQTPPTDANIQTPPKEVNVQTPPGEAHVELTPNEKRPAEQKAPKQHKMMDVNTAEVSMVTNPDQEETAGKVSAPLSATAETCKDSSSDVVMKEAAPVAEVDEVQVVDKLKEGE